MTFKNQQITLKGTTTAKNMTSFMLQLLNSQTNSRLSARRYSKVDNSPRPFLKGVDKNRSAFFSAGGRVNKTYLPGC